MANKRKGNLGYAAVNVNVKAHTRKVYKRKRFVVGKQTAKKQTAKKKHIAKKKGKGLAGDAVREIGKKVISKVIPVPNIVSISGVAQTITDFIKKKPAPHVKPKYSPWAEKHIRQKQTEVSRKHSQTDKKKRKSKCFWPYIYKPPGWKEGDPCKHIRFSPDAHKYNF